MVEKLISQVKLEIEQIDELFYSYASLIDKIQVEEPNLVEMTACASVLHSFYNGLENIFLCVMKNVDEQAPAGNRWHRDLLESMGKSTTKRQPVLTDETSTLLIDYLGFRHFYRHSYTFSLDWLELGELVLLVRNLWQQIKDELNIFLASVSD